MQIEGTKIVHQVLIALRRYVGIRFYMKTTEYNRFVLLCFNRSEQGMWKLSNQSTGIICGF